MRIIAYACGKTYMENISKISGEMIAAVSDIKKIDEQIPYCDRYVSPENIESIVFDYVAVFSNRYFNEIREMLNGIFFIPADRIIPWFYLMDKNRSVEYSHFFLRELLCREKKEKILDVGMKVLPLCVVSKNTILSEKQMLYGISSCNNNTIHANLYDEEYENEGYEDHTYDTIIINDLTATTITVLNRIFTGKERIVLLSSTYREILKNKIIATSELKKYGRIRNLVSVQGECWIVEKAQDESTDISIYVVTHKRYNYQSNELYRPFFVCGYNGQDGIYEAEGDNIEALNDRLNESTAIYWIWKNSKERIVGLNHYRRYFYKNLIMSIDNYLAEEDILEIMREYDLIIAREYILYNYTVIGAIEKDIGKKLTRDVFGTIHSYMEKRQPDYVDSFDNVMRGYSFYPCNLFITRKEILDSYAEWLFSFMIEATNALDLSGYDQRQRRAFGFFSERMLTVWLNHNKFKIKQMPYTGASVI